MAQNQSYTAFGLYQDGYLGFDATSIKELLNQRLKQTGVFTEQIYEGSNISALNDVLAYLFHLLLFYCNQTSSEGLITTASLYENINRLVKLVNFNPIGYSTSMLSFNALASSALAPNVYNIPRFSYLNVLGTTYVFTKDTSFVKTLEDSEESLEQFSRDNLLYQGTIIEHPLQTALGEDYEVITLVPGSTDDNNDIIVDHFNFSVFVKDAITNVWSEWTETESLFLENNTAQKYSKRLNESKYYEFTFGNDIYGKKLNEGDQIAIYYLKSDGVEGQVDANSMTSDNSLKFYNSTQFNTIMNQISNVSFISSSDAVKLTFSNRNNSTPFVSYETGEEIKNNLPKVFNSHKQLLTADNIETFVNRNYKNSLSSCKAVNNKTYISEYIGYFKDNLSLTKANKDSRVLYNQINFSTSCGFNNIYLFMSPSIGALNSDGSFAFVSDSQKQNIINRVAQDGGLTTNLVAMDPMYMAFAPGILLQSDDIVNNVEFSTQTINDVINDTSIIITKYKNSRKNSELIKSEAETLIQELFEKVSLGENIKISNVVNYILSIEGVKSLHTERKGVILNGINFLYWNPIYNGIDLKSTSNDINLNFFQYPYLQNKTTLFNQIQIVTES